MSEVIDWIAGDHFGLPIPAHAEALRQGGAEFLTRAFRAAGSLGPDDSVRAMTASSGPEGGSTGSKLRLQLDYAGGEGLPRRLFVKFSRDFTDPIRDRAKIQMESEVRMGLLSHEPAFPVAVPRCLFADYHRDSGTGVLITDEVAFGRDGIEPHHEKCRDTELADPFGHYRALLKANARLAGVHRAGGFPAAMVAPFADRSGSLGVSDRPPYTAEQVARRVDKFRAFAEHYPQLLPDVLRSESFLAQFAQQAPQFCGHEDAIADFLDNSVHYNALCHWNANIDNAWFWRDGAGELHCGLLDWGNARVMNMGVALAGSLMGAEADFLVANLDALLAGYADEFAAVSGETLDVDELRMQMALHNAASGLMWLLDAPAMIQRFCPDLDTIESRFDPRFRDNELLRNQLNMLTVFLTLWQHLDFGAILAQFLVRRG